MITGTTSSGFEFSVPDDLGDNMELVDALADYDDGNALALSKICLMMLGKPQRAALYDHVRSESGKVSLAKVGKELMEIVEEIGKNSSSSPA